MVAHRPESHAPEHGTRGPRLQRDRRREAGHALESRKGRCPLCGTGHTFGELAALGKDRKPLPHFPLNVSFAAKAKLEKKDVDSANIVAKLPGSDPTLKNEYVVLSAHIDHIGIGEPINGDRIYNGAMDNASGSAVLLDVAASSQEISREAEALHCSSSSLPREEKGLLGSKYFAQYPTVDPKSMVADINIDMFLPIIPLKTLMVWGLAESDLGDLARRSRRLAACTSQADPEPAAQHLHPQRPVQFHPPRNSRAGHGCGSRSQIARTEEIFKDWLTNRYHAPSDDLAQPSRFLGAAAQYEEIIRRSHGQRRQRCSPPRMESRQLLPPLRHLSINQQKWNCESLNL